MKKAALEKLARAAYAVGGRAYIRAGGCCVNDIERAEVLAAHVAIARFYIRYFAQKRKVTK